MTRTFGVSEPLSSLPELIVIAFAGITQLGDLWFTFSACALIYWLGPWTPKIGPGLSRDRTAMVVALLVGAVALTVSLKAFFALPRPPDADVAAHASRIPATVREIYIAMATGTGYGFPSGHAITSLLVWSGFAWAIRVGTWRRRAAVAAGVILLVGISRLVIGVHYFVDVLAGFAVAGAFLWIALAWLRDPERVFALAAVIALGGLLVGGLTRETGATLGMAVGGGIVWFLVGDSVLEPSRRGARITTVLGFGTIGMLLVVALGVNTAPLVLTAIAAAGTGLILALPLIGEHVAEKTDRRTVA